MSTKPTDQSINNINSALLSNNNHTIAATELVQCLGQSQFGLSKSLYIMHLTLPFNWIPREESRILCLDWVQQGTISGMLEETGEKESKVAWFGLTHDLLLLTMSWSPMKAWARLCQQGRKGTSYQGTQTRDMVHLIRGRGGFLLERPLNQEDQDPWQVVIWHIPGLHPPGAGEDRHHG